MVGPSDQILEFPATARRRGAVGPVVPEPPSVHLPERTVAFCECSVILAPSASETVGHRHYRYRGGACGIHIRRGFISSRRRCLIDPHMRDRNA